MAQESRRLEKLLREKLHRLLAVNHPRPFEVTLTAHVSKGNVRAKTVLCRGELHHDGFGLYSVGNDYFMFSDVAKVLLTKREVSVTGVLVGSTNFPAYPAEG